MYGGKPGDGKMYKGKTTIEIDKDEPLHPGDRVLLTFSTFGGSWITAANVALIERALEGRKEFRIRSHSLPTNQSVVFEVEVIKHNPVLITCAVIGGIMVAVGIVGFMLLTKTERIVVAMADATTSPAGQIATVGFTMIIGALVAYLIFRK